MKRVLLIGDSIRLSYMDRVKEKLKGIADVWGPQDNCRFAKYTLWNIPDYLSFKPDIVHWNNGIWDLFRKDFLESVFTPKQEYLKYIKLVMEQFVKYGAKVVWASTTPVAAFSTRLKNSEIDDYNAAVAEIMTENGILINDLNTLLKKDIEKLTLEDGFHLNENGVEVCAGQIAGILSSIIND